MSGIVSAGDGVAIAKSREEIAQNIEYWLSKNPTINELKHKFNLGKHYPEWLNSNRTRFVLNPENYVSIAYRPFDDRWTYYDSKILWRRREVVMKHFINGPNVALVFCRQTKASLGFQHAWICDKIADANLISNRTTENAYIAPLYLYSDDGTVRSNNLQPDIVNRISEIIGQETAPIALFDYVYGTLFDENYRQKYTEFLKIDFPRIPYPSSFSDFESRRNLGRELRLLHLLEHPRMTRERLNETGFPVPGNGRVESVKWSQSRVYINETQYFSDVAREVFDYYVGGYQPAHKWLKDRETLAFEDVQHYQKIVFAIRETLRLTQAQSH